MTRILGKNFLSIKFFEIKTRSHVLSQYWRRFIYETCNLVLHEMILTFFDDKKKEKNCISTDLFSSTVKIWISESS